MMADLFSPRKKPNSKIQKVGGLKVDQSDYAKAANVIFKINVALLFAGANVCSLLDYSFMAFDSDD